MFLESHLKTIVKILNYDLIKLQPQNNLMLDNWCLGSCQHLFCMILFVRTLKVFQGNNQHWYLDYYSMSWYLFLAPLVGQNTIWIFGNFRCLLYRKVWCSVWICSFCPKLRYFIYQNGPKRRSHESKLWLLSNTKMNVTNS